MDEFQILLYRAEKAEFCESQTSSVARRLTGILDENGNRFYHQKRLALYLYDIGAYPQKDCIINVRYRPEGRVL